VQRSQPEEGGRERGDAGDEAAQFGGTAYGQEDHGWASRLEGHFAPIFDPPDVAGVDLVEVVDGLLALEK
jgi:hypothetical protein